MTFILRVYHFKLRKGNYEYGCNLITNLLSQYVVVIIADKTSDMKNEATQGNGHICQACQFVSVIEIQAYQNLLVVSLLNTAAITTAVTLMVVVNTLFVSA